MEKVCIRQHNNKSMLKKYKVCRKQDTKQSEKEQRKLKKLQDETQFMELMEIVKTEKQMSIKRIKRNKTSMIDKIPIEVLVALGKEEVDLLCNQISKIDNQENAQEEWQGSVIVLIFKRKNVQKYANYWEKSIPPTL